jgi:hypothetical protein
MILSINFQSGVSFDYYDQTENLLKESCVDDQCMYNLQSSVFIDPGDLNSEIEQGSSIHIKPYRLYRGLDYNPLDNPQSEIICTVLYKI